MNINININEKEHPILFKLKKKELNNICKHIFNLGYEIYSPNNLDNKMDNNKITNKIDNLEVVLEKLIGLSVSSSKKGELAENILENIITKKYGDIKYNNMSQVNHSGDAWLNFDSFNQVVMLESKNYNIKVNKEEVIKMKNDMITNNIQWGILVSFNSKVQGYRNFDIETFNHQGKIYTIVILSELSIDIDRIDMAIQVVRKLINNYSKLSTFPWITSKVKSDLDKLNELINLNYQLRNWFNDMETNIKTSLNKYYSNMREYQNKIDNSIIEITNNIQGTIKESIESDNKFDYIEFVNNHKDNKKIFLLLSKIVDKIKQKNIIINNNNLLINDTIIGNIKIQKKKIIIYSENLNATCEFNIDQENTNSFNFINIF